jgi:exosortase A
VSRVNSFEHVDVRRRSSWYLTLNGFAAVTAAFLALYWATAWSLVDTWARTGMFRYAFLIFPVSAWLVWHKRREIRITQTPAVWAQGLLLLAAVSFIWLLGAIANVNLLQHIAFVAAFPTFVLLFFGPRVALMLLFPLVYLVFAIPAGHSAVGPLQTVTATLAVKFLQWTAVPELLEGHHIMTPSADWLVEQACSGIRFFLACTALGSLFAYLMFSSYWRRFWFIVASMIVPIIANGLRVYFTILIGEHFGLKYAQGTDHLIFGWQFFGTVLFLMFLVGWFLREPPPSPPQPVYGIRSYVAWPRLLTAAIGALAILVATTAAAAWINRHEAVPATAQALVLRQAAEGWQPVAGGASWQPQFAGADLQVRGAYANGSQRAMLFAAAYRGAQVDGHDLLAYRNALYTKELWAPASTSARSVAGGIEVRQLILASGHQRRMIWYWYRVNGQTFTSKALVRGWQSLYQLRGIPLHSAVVAVATDYTVGNAAAAVETLQRFTAAIYPRVERVLDAP